MVKKESKEKDVIRPLESYDSMDEEYDNEDGIWDYIRIGLLLILLAPFLIIGGIITVILAILTSNNWKKCKHWRECPWYNPKDDTCTEDGGMYYGYEKPAGCYYSVEERKEELKKRGKVLRRLR